MAFYREIAQIILKSVWNYKRLLNRQCSLEKKTLKALLFRCSHRPAVSMTLWLRRDKFIQTAESCGGKGTARPLSHGKSAPTLAWTGFYWLNLHRNTGRIWKVHQSFSGRNDQIIDNIQITLRAYSESGSDS